MKTATLQYYSWPIGITLTLLSVVIVYLVMIYFALGSQTALVTDNPYEKSLEYDLVYNELRSGQSSGLQPTLSLIQERQDIYRVALRLAENELLSEIKEIELQLVKPDNAALDKNVHMQKRAPGQYTSEELISGGLWLAGLRIHLPDRVLRFDSSISSQRVENL